MGSDGLTDEIEKLAALVVHLVEDASTCVTHGKLNTRTEPDQFWAGMLIRSFIVSIEGISYRARRVALAAHEQGEVEFNEAELALLKPEAFLTDQGKPKTQKRRLKTRPGILFGLDILRKALGDSRKVDRGDEGIGALAKVLDIRDRITHPRSIEGLYITREDIKTISLVSDWLGKDFKALAEDLSKRTAAKFGR